MSSTQSIAALVQQLKAGKISKTEMFDQLAHLQRSRSQEEAPAPAPAPAPTAAAASPGGAPSASQLHSSTTAAASAAPMSTSQRIILRLLHEKQQRQQAADMSGVSAPSPIAQATGNSSFLDQSAGAISVSELVAARANGAHSAQGSLASADNQAGHDPATSRRHVAPLRSASAHQVRGARRGGGGAAADVLLPTMGLVEAEDEGEVVTLDLERPESAHFRATMLDAGHSARLHSDEDAAAAAAFGSRARPHSANATLRRHSASAGDLRRSPSRQRMGESMQQAAAALAGSRSRAERAELELRMKQLEDCTFQPRIRPLPAHYGRTQQYSSVPFQERVTLWRQQKRAEAERKREEKEALALDGCTFQPAINETSRRVLEQSRQASEAGDRHALGTPAPERLYQEALRRARERESTSADELKSWEREQLDRDCTFRPTINPSPQGATAQVRARYMEAVPRREQGSVGGGSVDSQEYSFHPKTNPLRKDMDAARLYLGQRVFDRLAQPRRATAAAAAAASASAFAGDGVAAEGSASAAEGDSASAAGSCYRLRHAGPRRDEGGSVMDVASFLHSVAGRLVRTPSAHSVGDRQRPASAPRARSGVDGGDSVTSDHLTAEERRRQQQQRFKEFLLRQQQQQLHKQKRVAELTQQLQPPPKPSLCPRSLRMVGSSSFLDRLARQELRKQQHQRKQQAEQARDPECTFAPAINNTSRERPARSVVELSRGDMLRRETAQRLMKLRAEQDEMSGLTFRPHLNPRSVVFGESRLKVTTEPQSYLQRLQEEERRFGERQRRALQEQEAEEFKECTFAPQVHDAPGYVKRMAASMALSRMQRSQTETPARPAWR